MVFDLHNDKRSNKNTIRSIWTTYGAKIRPYKNLWHIEDIGNVDIDEIIRLKPFSVGLTWNYKNKVASGCLSRGGLTAYGAGVVRRLTEAGIIIDLAHLNKQSFWDVVKIVPPPLFCSHTGFGSHPRCLDDKQIQAIVDSGGLIGLTPVESFVPDFNTQLNYFVERWGARNIGYASDEPYGYTVHPPEYMDDNARRFINDTKSYRS